MRNIIAIAILSVVIFVSCNNSSKTKNTNAKPLVVATADATEKYQCPMNCEGDTAYTTEGQCPVCEMDLEKVTN